MDHGWLSCNPFNFAIVEHQWTSCLTFFVCFLNEFIPEIVEGGQQWWCHSFLMQQESHMLKPWTSANKYLILHKFFFRQTSTTFKKKHNYISIVLSCYTVSGVHFETKNTSKFRCFKRVFHNNHPQLPAISSRNAWAGDRVFKAMASKLSLPAFAVTPTWLRLWRSSEVKRGAKRPDGGERGTIWNHGDVSYWT